MPPPSTEVHSPPTSLAADILGRSKMTSQEGQCWLLERPQSLELTLPIRNLCMNFSSPKSEEPWSKLRCDFFVKIAAQLIQLVGL